MDKFYKLEGHTAVPCSMEELAIVYTENRRVARTEIGDQVVSTVFLGLDHQHYPGGPPMLFETLVFTNDDGGYMERCSTWEEAEAMHERVCNNVREGV